MAEVLGVAIKGLYPRSDGQSVQVADLAGGSGLTLASTLASLAANRFEATAMYNDINCDVSRLAEKFFEQAGHAVQCTCADSLRVEPWAGTRADLVVCDPPLGARSELSPREALPLWARAEKSVGWQLLGASLAQLAPASQGGGRVLAFLPQVDAFNRFHDRSRSALLSDDLVEAVVLLPGGLHRDTTSPLFLLVLNSAKRPRRRGKTLVMDLRRYFVLDSYDARRRLAPQGLRELEHGLLTFKASAVSQLVDTSSLFFVDAEVVRLGESGSHAWRAQRFSLDQDRRDAELLKRYGKVLSLEAEWSEDVYSEFAPSELLDRPSRPLLDWAKQQGWGLTRLSALLVAPAQVVGGQAPAEAGTLFLPTAPNGVASLDSTDAGRAIRLNVDESLIRPHYLARWLNSDFGRQARLRAEDTASRGSNLQSPGSSPAGLRRLVDELVVPLVPLGAQESREEAQQQLDRVESLVGQAREALWTRVDPTRSIARFTPVLDESITTWIPQLPYPVGSALWTMETKRNQPAEQLKQCVHVWEAYAAFVGTVLLSAFARDPEDGEHQFAAIKTTLEKQSLSASRATLGTWKVIIAQLSAAIRRKIQSDDEDERGQIIQILGDPPVSALESIFSPEVVTLLDLAAFQRNRLEGHTGFAGRHETSRRVEAMTESIMALRDLVGPAWTNWRLVRPGRARSRGGLLAQEVEVAMGSTSPFLTEEVEVGKIMDEDVLYLLAPGAKEPLRLRPLVQLQQAPQEDEYTSYFFSRVDGCGKASFVSYQSSTESVRDVPIPQTANDMFSLVRE